MTEPDPVFRTSNSAIPLITSRQNPFIKEIQKIRDDRNAPLIFLEGARLVQEALLSQFALEILVVSDEFPETSFLDPLRSRAKQNFIVSKAAFGAITDVENPQGILAIVRRPTWKWEDLMEKTPAPLLILDGLQDPGNAASIVRTAEAAGAAGVVTTKGTVHLFSPKAIRGAMGSTLRLPIIEHRTREDIVKEVKKKKYGLLGTTVLKETPDAKAYNDVDWKQPWAIVVGQEGQGLSKEWKDDLVRTLHIPMCKPVESLNVAASAAVILYESARQRA